MDPAIGLDQAQDNDLFEHGDVVLSHAAVQGVEQMMTCAVSGVAGAGDFGAAEGALGYAAVVDPAKRRAPVFHFVYGARGLLAESRRGGLVGQKIAAFEGVVSVLLD